MLILLADDLVAWWMEKFYKEKFNKHKVLLASIRAFNTGILFFICVSVELISYEPKVGVPYFT